MPLRLRFLQPGLLCHISRRSARPEPGVKHVPGQPVLGARLSRLHDKIREAPSARISHVRSGESNRSQALGSGKYLRFKLDCVLNTFPMG